MFDASAFLRPQYFERKLTFIKCKYNKVSNNHPEFSKIVQECKGK